MPSLSVSAGAATPPSVPKPPFVTPSATSWFSCEMIDPLRLTTWLWSNVSTSSRSQGVAPNSAEHTHVGRLSAWLPSKSDRQSDRACRSKW